MRILYLLSAALMVIVLQGCSATSQVKDPRPDVGALDFDQIDDNKIKPCAVNVEIPGECVIQLRVLENDPDKCIELANADDDLITLKGAKGNFLYWRIIDSPDYIFTRDGIAFVDNFRPRVFSEGERGTVMKNEYRWKFTGNRRRVNGYVITVRKPAAPGSPARECELDPWIRNK